MLLFLIASISCLSDRNIRIKNIYWKKIDKERTLVFNENGEVLVYNNLKECTLQIWEADDYEQKFYWTLKNDTLIISDRGVNPVIEKMLYKRNNDSLNLLVFFPKEKKRTSSYTILKCNTLDIL